MESDENKHEESNTVMPGAHNRRTGELRNRSVSSKSEPPTSAFNKMAVRVAGGPAVNMAIEASNAVRDAYVNGEARRDRKMDELGESINEKLDDINRMSRDLKINNSDLSIATYNACVVYNTRDITKLDMGVSDKVLKEKMSLYIDVYSRSNIKTSSALDISFHVLSFLLYGTVLFLSLIHI